MFRILTLIASLAFCHALFAQADQDDVQTQSNPELQRSSEPGLLTPSQTGLPETLWIDDTAHSMVRIVSETKAGNLPLINSLLLRINLSESTPALLPGNSETLGAAKLKYLLNIGALDAAEALVALYDLQSPFIRAEAETIALLSTRPEQYCQGLLAGEYEEIQNGMKIYCLARNSEWEKAAQELEELAPRLSPERLALLKRFLDLDNQADPMRDEPWIALPPSFEFVLDESLGRPRGLVRLPPAYFYFSRESGVTPRTDLEITEELVFLGSLPMPNLFAAYRAKSSAESGGAWGRAEVVEWLDKVDKNTSETELLKILEAAHERFGSVGLERFFAIEAKDSLRKFDPATFENLELRNAFLRMGILGGWSHPNWSVLIPTNQPDMMLAHMLTLPESDVQPNQVFTMSPIGRIVKDAFFSDNIDPLEAQAFGDAIWQSLFVIDQYTLHPEHMVAGAFQSLSISGLDLESRQIAIAYLLMDQKQ